MSVAALPRPLPLATAALLCASLLSACYVVPIDPRSGRPLPVSDGAGGTAAAPAPAAVPAPVPQAPSAPSVLTARLYPLNQPANTGGLLVAQIIDNHGGRGSISLQYRGALLQGESTRVTDSSASYGRIHREVLGEWVPSSGRRGIANAYGANGVNAQCEYVLTGPALGTGACLFSDGAKYRIHFG